MGKTRKNSNNGSAKNIPADQVGGPNRKSNPLLQEVLGHFQGKKYTKVCIPKNVPRGTLRFPRNKKEGILEIRIADHSAHAKNLFKGWFPPDYVISVTIADVDPTRKYRTQKRTQRNVIELDYDSSFTSGQILEDISIALKEITRKIQGEKSNLVQQKT